MFKIIENTLLGTKECGRVLYEDEYGSQMLVIWNNKRNTATFCVETHTKGYGINPFVITKDMNEGVAISIKGTIGEGEDHYPPEINSAIAGLYTLVPRWKNLLDILAFVSRGKEGMKKDLPDLSEEEILHNALSLLAQYEETKFMVEAVLI